MTTPNIAFRNNFKRLLFSILFSTIFVTTHAQNNSVAIGSETVNNKAVLMLVGDNQGLMIPVVSDRNAIGASASEEGMIVYDNADNKIHFFNGTGWFELGGGSGGGGSYAIQLTDNNLQLLENGNPVGAAIDVQTVDVGGDASGTIGNITVSSIQGNAVNNASLNNTTDVGKVMLWNGSEWVATALASGSALTAGTGIDISGTEISNTGDTDATDDITTSDISDTGSGIVISDTERTKLNEISGTNTGDETTFAGSGTSGIVPDPGSQTGKVLQDDGTWVTPAGGGDMTKATYDGDDNGVVDAAETSTTVTTNANLTGPVTSTGNTTAIANGAITNAMLANGDVANLSGTNTGDEITFAGSGTSGIVPDPGSQTGKVLQDDGTWVTPAGGGDMTKATYDGDDNGVVDAAETATTVTTNANLTGPVTSTGNTTAIANGAITNAMLANGDVANLSGTNTGDETTFAGSGTSGIVPDPGSETGKVLQDDGTWVSAGSGDMTKATYDGDDNGVVDAAETATSVTTNANLTGPVTSTGNATAIANGAITNAMLANTDVANLSGTNTGDQTNITGNAATVTTNANLTGPVTSTGNATAIADEAITLSKIANGTVNGQVMRWDGTDWVLDLGANKWTSGAATANNGDGELDGSYYLDTSTGEVYYKTGGAYGSVGNIKGTDGVDGDKYATSADDNLSTGQTNGGQNVALTLNDASLAYTVGQSIVVASRSDNTRYFEATVDSYTDPVLNVTSTASFGSGNANDWDVNLTGAPGAAGESAYIYVGYASDAGGTGFSTTAGSLEFIGFATSNTVLTPVMSDFISFTQFRNLAAGDMLQATYDGNADNIVDVAATVTTNANLTGPVTSTGNATAIANGAITNAMLANTAVANLSGVNSGDASVFANGSDGLVPDPGPTTGRVLQDDGTWVAAGSGDMTKATYDGDDNGVVDAAETATTVTTNANLTGPVTSTGNATAIDNGAITNAMLANADVANLSGTNTGDEVTFAGNGTSGNVPDPGSETGKVLQDDGTWVIPTVGAATLQEAYDGGQALSLSSGDLIINKSDASPFLATDEASSAIEITGNLNLLNSGQIFGDGNRMFAAGTNTLSVGKFAGFNGTDNVYVGAQSGQNSDESSFRNSFFGKSSGQSNTTGVRNTFLGTWAGGATTTGTSNTFVGSDAAFNNTTGSNNTFVGGSAGSNNNLIGSSLTLIGANSEVSSDGLNNATAIGASAVVDASNTVRLGVDGTALEFNGELRPGGAGTAGTAGQVLTSAGPGLVPTWSAAGGSVVTNDANSNLYGGTNAGSALTSGTDNTILGDNAGTALTTESENVIIGSGAGQNSTSGGANNFIGVNAGANNSGDANNFIGYAAGNANTSGGWNIFVGHNAGQTNLTGSNNIAIGRFADVGSDGLTNAIAIGQNAVVDQSNSIVLGGTGANAVNVGIRTNTPGAIFHINDNASDVDVTTNNGAFMIGAANNVNIAMDANEIMARNNGATTNLSVQADGGNFVVHYNLPVAQRFVVQENGFVGIGNITPTSDLQIGNRGHFQYNESANGTVMSNNLSEDLTYTVDGQGGYFVINDDGSLIFGNTNGFSGTAGNNAVSDTQDALRIETDGVVKVYNSIALTDDDTNTDQINLQAPTDVTVDYTLTLPPAVGASGQVLRAIDAAGNLEWATIGAGSGWGLTGNAGTDDATDFIGTTDTQDLVFRQNGIQAGRVHEAGFNNSFGKDALTIVSSGTFNTAMGASALGMATTGAENSAFGGAALSGVVGGGQNTAIGFQALRNMTGADGNTAIGWSALVDNQADSNIGIGVNAGASNTTGSGNVYVGNSTGAGNTSGDGIVLLGAGANVGVDGLNNATAIGANANVSASNSLVLGNGANVGIGTTSPTDKLDIEDGGVVITPADSPAGPNWMLFKNSDDRNASWGFNDGNASNRDFRFLRYDAAGSFVDRIMEFENATGDIKIFNNVRIGDGLNAGAGLDVESTNGARINGWASMGASVGGSAYFGSNIYRNSGDNAWKYTNTHGSIGGSAIVFNNLEGAGAENDILFVNTTTPSTANADATVTETVRIKQNGNVGIGTNAPVAKLDVAGNIKIADGTEASGRVLTSDVDGLATWQDLPVAGGSWGITGNSISPGQFIGTTNSEPLEFRQNNFYVGRLNSNNGNMFIGGSAGIANSGNTNTAFGQSSFQNNPDGNDNVAIGVAAMNGNNGGSGNTAIGAYTSIADGLSNATTIGNGAAATQDNTVILGSGADVGIGTSAPTANLEISDTNPRLKISGEGGSSTMLIEHANATSTRKGVLQFDRAKGDQTTKAVVADGDDLGQIIARGYDGAAYGIAAGIDFEVHGTVASNDIPASIIFSTNPAGAGLNTERMRIDSDGVLSINDLATGGASEMVVADAAGLLTTQVIPGGTSASNGLTLSGSVQLGGTLTQNTSIDRNDFALNLTGGGSLNIGEGNTISGTTNSMAIGTDNTVNASATVGIAIGSNNTIGASGHRSIALGNYVQPSHLGSMLLGDWSGSAPATTASSTINQFTSRFDGGYRFYTTSDLDATAGVYFANGGNVGIGTLTPSEKLDVEGSINIAAGSAIKSGGTSMLYKSGTVTVLNALAGETIRMTQAGTSRLAINASGNVGIGTTGPSAKLDVNGTSEFNGTADFNGAIVIGGNMISNDGGTDEGLSIGTRGQGNILVPAVSTGNVTTSPQDGLTLMWQERVQNLGVGEGLKLKFAAELGDASQYEQAYISSYKASSSDTYQSADLRFGTNPGGGSSAVERMIIHNNGSVTVHGVLTHGSDERWKKNIETYDGALQKVLRSRGVNYEWKTDEFKEKGFKEGMQIGFIAQEVEKNFPELVLTDEEGFKSVNYSMFTAVLVESTKEQQKLIEDQESRIAELEKQIELAKAENTSLKASATTPEDLKAMKAQIMEEVKAMLGAEAKVEKK